MNILGYATCGSSKAFCEKDFEKCMKNLCKSNFPSKPECIGAAEMYTMGTTMFGSSGYDESQAMYCECTKEDNVLKHYELAMEHYYSKWKPEKKDNAKAVIKKSKHAANTGSDTKPIYKTIYRLFYELMKKYDNGIVHIGKRKLNKNIPRPIMKGEEL